MAKNLEILFDIWKIIQKFQNKIEKILKFLFQNLLTHQNIILWRTSWTIESKKAMEYFAKLHSNKMYDHFPYFKHLQDVVKVLERFGFHNDIDLIIAGFGHDSIEDAGASYSDIKRNFNVNIAEIIYCVSDEKGRTRKEKKEKTLPGIRANPDAIIIKLADRIANSEHSIAMAVEGKESNYLTMYKEEYKSFRWTLYVPGHVEEMWSHLDHLMGYAK